MNRPIFQSEDAARRHLEALAWPHGPTCPHCKATGDAIAAVQRKIDEPRNTTPEKKWRPQREGLYYCNECKATFTVTVGTVMERSRIPLTKWVAAFHVMAAAKKSGVSRRDLALRLSVSDKTAGLLLERIRMVWQAPVAHHERRSQTVADPSHTATDDTKG